MIKPMVPSTAKMLPRMAPARVFIEMVGELPENEPLGVFGEHSLKREVKLFAGVELTSLQVGTGVDILLSVVVLEGIVELEVVWVDEF